MTILGPTWGLFAGNKKTLLHAAPNDSNLGQLGTTSDGCFQTFDNTSHALARLNRLWTTAITVQGWVLSDQREWACLAEEVALQDALFDSDRDMLRCSSDDSINVFTDSVVGFIVKLVDGFIPEVTIRIFPN